LKYITHALASTTCGVSSKKPKFLEDTTSELWCSIPPNVATITESKSGIERRYMFINTKRGTITLRDFMIGLIIDFPFPKDC